MNVFPLEINSKFLPSPTPSALGLIEFCAQNAKMSGIYLASHNYSIYNKCWHTRCGSNELWLLGEFRVKW